MEEKLEITNSDGKFLMKYKFGGEVVAYLSEKDKFYIEIKEIFKFLRRKEKEVEGK